MSKWNNQAPSALISSWRRHRETTSLLTIEDALQEIVKYWASCPRATRCIDYYTPDTWPTPWEILSDKMYCNNTVSLMMYYTIKMLFPDENIKLYLIDSDSDEYIVPVLGDSLLNFDYQSVLSFKKEKKNFKVIGRIREDEIPKVL